MALPDGEGGAFIIYTAMGSGTNRGKVDVEIKRLDGSGHLLWNGGKTQVDVSAARNVKRNLRGVIVSYR